MNAYHLTADGHVYRGLPRDDYSTHNYTPVVVIDPEDEATVRRLAHAYGCHHERRTWNMQAALRSLLEPPKPDEPTGLGAVVADAHGDKWVRISAGHSRWYGPLHGGRAWSAVDAVTVLSPGVPDGEV